MSFETTILIAALATYRLTLLVSKEAGPFDIFGRFRTWAGVKYDEYSKPYATGQLSEMILCPYCSSVWVGIGVTILVGAAAYLNLLTLITFVLLPLALSGLSVFFFKWTGV
jgi:uncharacterized protein DUF1360